jgi:hypothetical protein
MTPNFWFGSMFGWVDAVVIGIGLACPIIALLLDLATLATMDLFDWCPKHFNGFFAKSIIQDEKLKRVTRSGSPE